VDTAAPKLMPIAPVPVPITKLRREIFAPDLAFDKVVVM
jgi:hypothetical protein